MQEAIDIAFHMVTDEGWGVPGSYADAFPVLAERGVVDRPDALDAGAVARFLPPAAGAGA